MEQLIILVIWVIGSTIIKSSNEKNKKNKTNQRAKNLKRSTTLDYGRNKKDRRVKTTFDSFMEDVEKELRSEKDSQREKDLLREKEKRDQIESQWMQSSVSQPSQPSQPKKQPKPIGLANDMIGGDVEIGKSGTHLEVEHINKLGLDLKKDILKGIIYAEILSEPKALKNIRRSG